MSLGAIQDPDTLSAWLHWAAGKYRDRVALLSEESDPITHAALHDIVIRFRADLRRFGVGRGDRVAILLSQGPGLALAFLAVAASATAAPLNPTTNAAELETTLRELEPRALILARDSFAEARSVATRLGVAVLDLDPNAGGAGRPGFLGTEPLPLPAADDEARPTDVALVLNTSGTTSRPKRVPLSHANLLASAGAIRRTLRLGPEDRGLCVMPLFHIHGLIAGLLAPLGSGGSVVCAPAFNPDRFLEQLARWSPTWYTAVPTMHQAILARVTAQSGWSAPATLRFIRSSSSALPPPVMAGLEAAARVPVIESYGMTEASHQMASNPLPPAVRKPGSVGPAAGPEIAILGPDGGWASFGVRGEVVIRGPGVTRGYENLPVDSPSPFHEGWFRTGDQGFLDPDGYLFLTGRLKELINRGGEKITPREIDEVLLEFPCVAQAVAFAVPHESLGEDVAAAVVPVPGMQLDEPTLRQFVFSRLAAFKVPSRILVVSDLPKGPSGKVQRIGLAKAFARELVSEFADPESPEEREIAGIFAQVLGRDRVGRNENFFSSGGDSLKATQVVNRLQQALGFEIPVATVFRHPTPAQLAGALASLREAELGTLAADPIPVAVPLQRGGHPPVAVYRASRSQQRMWFLYQLAPDSAAYSVPSVWHLRGPVNERWMQLAYRAVVRCHDALRTTFSLEDDGLVQRVHASTEVQWECRDLSCIPALDRSRPEEEALSRAVNRGVDLETESPNRMLLLRLGPEEFLLMLQVHHIVFDGASRLAFLRDFSASYAALAAGGDGALPPAALQAADVSAWQEERLSQGRLARDEAFWMSSLAGVVGGPVLPRDFERPELPTFAGDTRVRALDPGLRERLHSAAGAEGATEFMMLLAAFAVLLRRESGQSDLVVCIPISGRNRAELEPVVGFLANSLPLRLRVSDAVPFREFLAQVRSVVLNAHAHQEVLVERLVELLPGAREHAGAPLLSVFFGIRERTDTVLRLPGVEVGEREVRTPISRFDLYLMIESTAMGWRAAAEFSTDLFKARRVEGWLESWQRILERVAADPGRRVEEC